MSIIYSGAFVNERAKSLLVQPPVATLIIRTYNEAKHLGHLLESVAMQKLKCGLPVEVIVVDSGSQDGTDAIALKQDSRLLRMPKEEFSFGRALNIGCAAANGEFLVLISGHCLPTDKNWLEELLRPFSDPRVAMTYGRQIGDESTKFSEARVFEKYYPDGPASQGPAFCNNANSAVRRSIWRRFRYDERSDWAGGH